MMVVGLTGSIGMGKSTLLSMFADLGVPVWNADAAVHRLYAPGGAGVEPIRALAPQAVGAGPKGKSCVDRAKLHTAILADPALLRRIEAAIHPLVSIDRDAFLAEARASGAALAICDIPLLFETGADTWLDTVIVVSAPADIQRDRVMERPGMTEATFKAILAKQMPDTEKRARADYIVDSSHSNDHTRAQAAAILAKLTGNLTHA
jgi:dephospho-CoA kinase